MNRKYPNRPHKPNLGNLESFLASTLREIEKLNSAVGQLPNVNPDGTSECPFAEELFATKEECQERLQGSFKLLREYAVAAKQEMDRIRGDLMVLSAQEVKINSGKVREHYTRAEVDLAAKYKHYGFLLEKLHEVMKLADVALAKAVVKRFPGRPPQKQPGVLPPTPPSPTQLLQQEIESTNWNQDIDDLLKPDDEEDQSDDPDDPEPQGQPV